MTGISDQELAVARVYSAAMLELARSQGDVDVLMDELVDLAHRGERDPEFAAFLSNPTIDATARKDTLEKLFRGRYTDLFVDALQVLNRKGRLGLLRGVAAAYRAARDELLGRIQVHVRAATPLTDPLREKLLQVARRQTGKEPDLIETVDESLIGGLVLQIGDRKLDASVAARLKKLSGALMERASREIHSERTYLEGTPVQ